MLYDIVIIALALLLPVSAYTAFKAGYNAARQIDKAEPIEHPRPPAKVKPQAETPEQRKARLLKANIENYGTPKPQREVR